MKEKKDFEKMLQEATRKEQENVNRDSNTTLQQNFKENGNRLSGSITNSNRTSIRTSTALDSGRYAIYSNKNTQAKGSGDFENRNREESLSAAKSRQSRAEIARSEELQTGSGIICERVRRVHQLSNDEIQKWGEISYSDTIKLREITKKAEIINEKYAIESYKEVASYNQKEENEKQLQKFYKNLSYFQQKEQILNLSVKVKKASQLVQDYENLKDSKILKENPLTKDQTKILQKAIHIIEKSKSRLI